MKKTRVYRLNKNGKLYYYDEETKKIGQASKKEKKDYAEQLKKEIIHDIKKTGYTALFLTVLGVGLLKKTNGYSNYQMVKTSIECFLDNESENQIICDEILSYIKIYKKEEYLPIYRYIVANYKYRLNLMDMRKIFELLKQDYETIIQKNNLVSDCIQSIASSEKEDYTGNIRLSIICDIVGKDEAIYLLLTNQEEKLINLIHEKTGITIDKVKILLLDLMKLNCTPNNTKDLDNYVYFDITEKIIDTYDSIPLEKELLLSRIQNKEVNFIPVGSFLSRGKDEYPIKVMNDTLNTVINVPSKTLPENIPNVLNRITNDFFESSLSSNSEILTLISYLQNKSPMMEYYYNNLSKKEKKEYIYGISNFYQTIDINLKWIIYGIEKNDEQAIITYLKIYLDILNRSDIDLYRICEINHILKYFETKEYENDLQKETIKRILAEFKEEIQNNFAFYGYEEYNSLVGKNDVTFTIKDNLYQIPQIIDYKIFKVKYDNDSNEFYWKVEIPKEDNDITPALLVSYKDGSVKYVNFNDFFANAKIVETDKFVIYEKRVEGEEIEVFNIIEEYLQQKRKGNGKKKINI